MLWCSSQYDVTTTFCVTVHLLLDVTRAVARQRNLINAVLVERSSALIHMSIHAGKDVAWSSTGSLWRLACGVVVKLHTEPSQVLAGGHYVLSLLQCTVDLTPSHDQTGNTSLTGFWCHLFLCTLWADPGLWMSNWSVVAVVCLLWPILKPFLELSDAAC